VKDTHFLGNNMKLLMKIIDEVAERIRDLNGKSLGTYSEYLHHCRLKEVPGEYPNDVTMISNLLADHEQIIRILRKDAMLLRIYTITMCAILSYSCI
jgi:starvation-inducible DNA-binding protein